MADANDPQIIRLSSRVGEPIESEADLSLAEESLDASWEFVRLYGNPEWDFLQPDTPAIAKTIALSAASRCYQNPSGFTMERGDSVTFQRYDDFAKGAELTRAEIAALKKVSKSSGRVVSLSISNPDIYQSRGKRSKRQVFEQRLRVGDPYFRPVSIYTWREDGSF